MLEELLKSEIKRFEEATLVHPTTTKLGPLGRFPQMPHVLQYESATGVRERIGERYIRLRAVRSSGLKLLAERSVIFHYETQTDEDGRGWSVSYPGQQLKPEDVANLNATVD